MSDKLVNVAIVGATGAVGETILEVLEERDFPVDQIFLLASERSAGLTRKFRNKSIKILDLADFDFSQVQIGLFSAGGALSAEYAPKAAAAGCIVIDNTSHFRYDDDKPLVAPEVNAHAIADYKKTNIIANPNCSTIQMVVALKPIHDAVGIERINVATYQAVSGSGKVAMEELAKQTASLLNGKPIVSEVYPKQIAFNVIPQIDVFEDNGYTRAGNGIAVLLALDSQRRVFLSSVRFHRTHDAQARSPKSHLVVKLQYSNSPISGYSDLINELTASKVLPLSLISSTTNTLPVIVGL